MRAKLAGGLAAAAILAAFAAAPAAAHHSVAMFDMQKVVEVTGEVVEFQYTNPHSWLIVAVTDENGEVTNWGFEAEGPSTLMRAGIGKNTFPPGMEVTVRGRPMRDGRPGGSWIDTTLPDGTVISPSGRPGPPRARTE